jgi:hypothetical protein
MARREREYLGNCTRNALTAGGSQNHDDVLTAYSVAFARSMEGCKRHGDEAQIHMLLLPHFWAMIDLSDQTGNGNCCCHAKQP